MCLASCWFFQINTIYKKDLEEENTKDFPYVFFCNLNHCQVSNRTSYFQNNRADNYSANTIARNNRADNYSANAIARNNHADNY